MAYFEGNTVTFTDDAINHYASWTAAELADLRDFWRLVDLRDLAIHLGRSEQACQSMYRYQRSRPTHERWHPATIDRRAFTGRINYVREHLPSQRVRSIHDDEELWWEPDYYR